MIFVLGSSNSSEFSASFHSECAAPDWKDEVEFRTSGVCRFSVRLDMSAGAQGGAEKAFPEDLQ